MSRRITKMARKMSQMLALGAYGPQMTPDDWSDMRAEIVALRDGATHVIRCVLRSGHFGYHRSRQIASGVAVTWDEHNASPPAPPSTDPTPDDARIAQIEARMAASTPGRWMRDRNWYVTAEGHDWEKCWLARGVDLDNYDRSHDKRICHVQGPGEGNNAEADFELIAAAPDDLRFLIAELARLREENAELRKDRDRLSHMLDYIARLPRSRLDLDDSIASRARAAHQGDAT